MSFHFLEREVLWNAQQRLSLFYGRFVVLEPIKGHFNLFKKIFRIKLVLKCIFKAFIDIQCLLTISLFNNRNVEKES